MEGLHEGLVELDLSSDACFSMSHRGKGGKCQDKAHCCLFSILGG